jgi:predicted dehydrogenase
MLKVGIIGCGKIASDHLEQITRIGGCRVIGACDLEPLMARQLCDRFEIEHCVGNVDELLGRCQPDVVHITTPPQNHFSLTKQCLSAGCHVYVEKPFVLDLKEAEDLIAFANSCQHKITVGHDLQFTHVARRLRQLTSDGFLGGQPVHMESFYCYDLSNAAYAKAFLANSGHWLRRLPGKLAQNVISHGIARLAEYFTTESPTVFAEGFVSPLLMSLGEKELIDEVRVMLTEQGRTTAYFTFSSQMRPPLNAFRIFGPKNGLALDQDQETLLKLRGKRFVSYAEKFIPPVTFARQYLSNLTGNLKNFARSDFHMKSGMKCLIESFYKSITNDLPPPIPYREILLTTKIMDDIFAQIYPTQKPAKRLNESKQVSVASVS